MTFRFKFRKIYTLGVATSIFYFDKLIEEQPKRFFAAEKEAISGDLSFFCQIFKSNIFLYATDVFNKKRSFINCVYFLKQRVFQSAFAFFFRCAQNVAFFKSLTHLLWKGTIKHEFGGLRSPLFRHHCTDIKFGVFLQG